VYSFNFDDPPREMDSEVLSYLMDESPVRKSVGEVLRDTSTPENEYLGWSGLQRSLSQWFNGSWQQAENPGVVKIDFDHDLAHFMEIGKINLLDSVGLDLQAIDASRVIVSSGGNVSTASALADVSKDIPSYVPQFLRLSMQAPRVFGTSSNWGLELIRPIPPGGLQQRISRFRGSPLYNDTVVFPS